jgi:ADP-ribosylation factor protein 1
MGNIFEGILSKIMPHKEAKILLLGLDAAGKSTILYKLKLGEVQNHTPTLGFNVESIVFKNIRFNMWDVGGQDILRPMWRHYYANSDAIIFVVDSQDRSRIDIAKTELHRMLSQEDLKNAVLLVFANKQDVAVMSVQEVT